MRFPGETPESVHLDEHRVLAHDAHLLELEARGNKRWVCPGATANIEAHLRNTHKVKSEDPWPIYPELVAQHEHLHDFSVPTGQDVVARVDELRERLMAGRQVSPVTPATPDERAEKGTR